MKKLITTFVMNMFLLMALVALLPAVASAEGNIVFAGISEASGAGAIAGSSFKNGYTLAIDEINASGGIAGKTILLRQFNIDTNIDAATRAANSAVALKPFAIIGPTFSGMTLATMAVSGPANIPHFVGGEAASIAKKYPANLFRTSLTQEMAIPRLAAFVQQAFQPKKVTLIYVDNDYGRDAKAIFMQSAKRYSMLVADNMVVQPGQTDFSRVVDDLNKNDIDALLIYTNEMEAAGLLKELRLRQFNKPVVGDGPLVSQQVIDMAGAAAEGVYAHTGVSVDAPVERVQSFDRRYRAKYNLSPDHNSLKAYFAVYAIKSLVDSVGVVEGQMFINEMKKARLDPQKQTNLPVRGAYDIYGTLYRESYLVQVRNKKQLVLATIPMGDGPTVELANGKEVILNSREGRKQFFAQTTEAAKK
ncbi:ABC transporter substrate-binding protein [Undibacterium sp. SXout7W]|uniref:ABC transporter substrate-binding protein n=1 Tax=Undibacterium sp. SXout7W TaxID=3413049 RepID=UPI003BEF9E67